MMAAAVAPTAPRRLVLASNNAKKLAELQGLLAPLGCELVTQGSLGVAEVDEPHHTFIENALHKARHAAHATGLPALADDSGLCVAALGGLPGVASAHYAALQEPQVPAEREARRAMQDAANNAKLLAALAAWPHAAQRRAHYLCVLVALRHGGDPEPLAASGRWHGVVRTAPHGAGGFGYDPLIDIPALGASVASLPATVKAAHSHRALAAAQLVALMQKAWAW